MRITPERYSMVDWIWLPIWVTTSAFFAASPIARASAISCASGFSQ